MVLSDHYVVFASVINSNFAFYFIAGLDFIYSQRGRPLIVVNNYLFRKNRGSYWRCIRCTKNKCKCRLILKDGVPLVVEEHSHGPETEKIAFGRKVAAYVPSKLDTPVQLFLRQPHFDPDEYQITVDGAESDLWKGESKLYIVVFLIINCPHWINICI